MKLNYKKTLFVIFFLSLCSTIVFLVFLKFSTGFRMEVHVLSIDNRSYLAEPEQYQNAYTNLPSLPLEFWHSKMYDPLLFNATCAKFPNLLNIEFQNLYWQNLRSSYGHYQIFGAYLDDRLANPLGPTVRFLAMVDQVEPIRTMYCQLWFADKLQPLVVKASKYDLSWHVGFGNYKKGIYQPYLIPCPITKDHHNLVITAASLVENPCDTASNVLTVFNNRPSGEKRNFAVCVKGMDFMLEDISSVLTEWIEMTMLLGANKIFMYNLNVHPNVRKVLKYYEDLGGVEVVPLTLPAGQPNTQFWQHIYLSNRIANKWQGEIIPYNDCLYKHMYEYKYVVLVDVDELIVPLNVTTWNDLLKYFHQNLKKKFDSYNARNVYFLTDLLFNHKWFNDIPDYMHILNHIYRDPNISYPGHAIKSFHSTETVLTLHNHFPVACLQGPCNNFAIDPEDALMHHYNRVPPEKYKIFRETSIRNTAVWRYKKPLIEKVTKALKDMGFLVSLK